MPPRGITKKCNFIDANGSETCLIRYLLLILISLVSLNRAKISSQRSWLGCEKLSSYVNLSQQTSCYNSLKIMKTGVIKPSRSNIDAVEWITFCLVETFGKQWKMYSIAIIVLPESFSHLITKTLVLLVANFWSSWNLLEFDLNLLKSRLASNNHCLHFSINSFASFILSASDIRSSTYQDNTLFIQRNRGLIKYIISDVSAKLHLVEKARISA